MIHWRPTIENMKLKQISNQNRYHEIKSLADKSIEKSRFCYQWMGSAFSSPDLLLKLKLQANLVDIGTSLLHKNSSHEENSKWVFFSPNGQLVTNDSNQGLPWLEWIWMEWTVPGKVHRFSPNSNDLWKPTLL